jgi:type II secretory pathway component PulF
MLMNMLKWRFNDRARIKIWKKLSALLRYNVPVMPALIGLHDRYHDRRHPLEGVFGDILRRMNGGASFDEAIQPWTPHAEVMLIRGGIRGNRLSESLLECVAIIDAKRKIMKSMKNAVSMPILLVAMLCLLFFVIAVYLVPRIALLADPDKFTGPAALVFSISSFLVSGGGIIFVVLLAMLVIAIIFSLPRWTGRYRVIADNIPPWSIYRLIVGSMWLYTMSILLRANVPLNQALEDMLNNKYLQPWLRERIERINDLYQDDANFGALLLRLNLNFPDKELLEELSVYAALPDFYLHLHEIASDWLTAGEERIEEQSGILNMILFILIGVMLSFVILSLGSITDQTFNFF